MEHFYIFILLLLSEVFRSVWTPWTKGIAADAVSVHTIPDSSKVIMYCQLLSGINSFHKDVAYARGSNFFILVKVVLFSKLKEHKVPLSRDNINSSPQ